MVRLFSRNTRLENHSDERLKVDVEVDRRFLSRKKLIPAGEHNYICYDDLGTEYNGGRLVEVLFYIESRPTEPIRIPTSDIRDHHKIIFSQRENGTIHHELVRGTMIQMNG